MSRRRTLGAVQLNPKVGQLTSLAACLAFIIFEAFFAVNKYLWKGIESAEQWAQ